MKKQKTTAHLLPQLHELLRVEASVDDPEAPYFRVKPSFDGLKVLARASSGRVQVWEVDQGRHPLWELDAG
eukprot:CAMPEP_0172737524 /NCGR_PEP_ID=MMETSP1074-20121228/117873_1 /TAXON_ID=2916 /ORGANISM="Ceratium fusus, Strain PA161109" /LENGTH=70 /DNA_ID=CAMNT_0013566933 /DNA_START=23 /DNA_END=232 /DNA_ORIENTATION=+